jgi:mannose-6-phosphate isomerase-like protein (cupin superfamily)
MKHLLFSFFLFSFLGSYAQATNAYNINPKEPYENIYSEKFASDSLSTSFIIWIKKEVKLHKHLAHSEHVVVIEGEGKMQLGEKEFMIKKGDIVFIPKNTPHKVVATSNIPLKVISIQSPEFDGTDRVLLE